MYEQFNSWCMSPDEDILYVVWTFIYIITSIYIQCICQKVVLCIISPTEHFWDFSISKYTLWFLTHLSIFAAHNIFSL